MNPSKARERWWLWPRLIILNLAGCCLLWALRDQVVSHDWRPAHGTIVNAEVHDQSVPNGAGGFASSSCLVVSYRYQVDGRYYVSNRYRAAGSCLSPDPRTMARYPAGGRVAVWYDAGDPGLAVLDTVRQWNGVWIWWLFLILIALGNGAFIEHARRRSRNSNQYET